MNIQSFFLRGLIVVFYSTGSLFSDESLAGLIINSIDSEVFTRERLFYNPTPNIGDTRNIISYRLDNNGEKRSSVNLSTQPVDITAYEAVDNFADAPPSDRYRLAVGGSVTASYTNSAEWNTFQSLIELDYGPLEAPDNPDYDTQDDDPYMFFVGGKSSALVSFNFSIDTPHEYALSYVAKSDPRKNNNAQPLTLFRFDQGERIYEANDFFFRGRREESVSGFLEPGNYFLLNDIIEQHSMEFGTPIDYGTPTTSAVTLSLKDLDSDGSESQTIPAPPSALLLLTGIGLLRLKQPRRDKPSFF